jgi:hypothetical protein
LVWIEGAPKLGVNTEEEICEFVDTTISGQLPNKDEDPDFHDSVQRYQTHGHRPKCQTKDLSKLLSKAELDAMTDEEKADARCRYGFARSVEEKTRLVIPEKTQEDLATAEAQAEDEMDKVRSTMSEEGKSEEEMEAAFQAIRDELALVRRNILQTSNVTINLKRRPEDVYVNNYNRTLLRANESNMDIQFVVNMYAAAVYLCGYVAKTERRLAEAIKKTMRELPASANARQRGRALARAFIRSRLISAQEVVHNLLGSVMLPYLVIC